MGAALDHGRRVAAGLRRAWQQRRATCANCQRVYLKPKDQYVRNRRFCGYCRVIADGYDATRSVPE
jgi:hypothetical protein